MFLHLGENVTVLMKDIIGIFSYENLNYNDENRRFIRLAEEDGFVIRISNDMPKSYVVAETDKQSKIYLSPISAQTLIKRSKEDLT